MSLHRWKYACTTCAGFIVTRRPGRGATPAAMPCWLCEAGVFRRVDTHAKGAVTHEWRGDGTSNRILELQRVER